MRIDAPAWSDISALRRLWREAFGDSDEMLDAFRQTAFSPTRCRCALIGGELAAALCWFDCEHAGHPIAYLYAVATAAAYRGRGIAHALMSDTHRHLAALGYAGAILVPAGAPLFAFYESMGYRTSCRVREIISDAAKMPIQIRKIDVNEYAALRRQYLPAGGVIQERENLAFLMTDSAFYTGGGFVLAARRKGDFLHGAELLGDDTWAPGIVRALGCRSGSFRTPGDDAPFAMYLPLCENVPPPAYFGLAFD